MISKLLTRKLGRRTSAAWAVVALMAAQANAQTPAWMTASSAQAQKVKVLIAGLTGQVPATIPQSLTYADALGKTTSYQPGGALTTSSNAFFATGLGGSTNGRTCFTCHQPQDGWGLKPATALLNYVTTGGQSALFQPVDGADCPSLITGAKQTAAQFLATHNQMLTKANTRIFIPENATHQWNAVTVVQDPTTCESSSVYGLNAPTPFASFYRRVLPSANTSFLDPQGLSFVVPSVNNTASAVMWDSREPSLQSQFHDAVVIHAQGSAGPTGTQVTQGVAFQDGLFSAQSFDTKAGDLTGGDGSGATGGPVDLSSVVLPSPTGFLPPFVPFDMFETTAFTAPTTGSATQQAQRESIERGEVIFNTRPFTVSGVAGLNDGPVAGPLVGATCSACHSTPSVGNDFFVAVFHTGVGDNSSASVGGAQGTATVLPTTSDMPVLAFWCPVGSIPFFSNPQVDSNGATWDVFKTEDAGYGWISGQCADLGKMKMPNLRGLAARPPYFHGGEAKTLASLVNFYNVRFSIGLSTQDSADLVNFLGTL